MNTIGDNGESAVAKWSILACSVVKPENDYFHVSQGVVWRANEDRFRILDGTKASMAAIADGAGSSGLFCGKWAEALVNALPPSPIRDLGGLDHWVEGFSLDFRAEQAARMGREPAKLGKFIREGSCSTLAACWLTERAGRVWMDWLGYGDSPILVFDRTGEDIRLTHAFPATLAAMARDPHLLNWKDIPVVAGFGCGSLKLPHHASIVVASDGVGQYVLLRALASAAGCHSALAHEFQLLAQNSNFSRLSGLAHAHAQAEATLPSFDGELAALRQVLVSDESFAAWVGQQHSQGLLANDDATLVMIDVDTEQMPVGEA